MKMNIGGGIVYRALPWKSLLAAGGRGRGSIPWRRSCDPYGVVPGHSWLSDRRLVMSEKVKKMLLVIGFMITGLVSYAGSCESTSREAVRASGCYNWDAYNRCAINDTHCKIKACQNPN